MPLASTRVKAQGACPISLTQQVTFLPGRAKLSTMPQAHRIKVTSKSLRQRRSFTPILKMQDTAVTVSSLGLADVYASYRTKHFGDRATI
jgi:hypothetical protein